MVKKRMRGYLKTVLVLLAIIILSHQALAATVGHTATAISAGMFESRRRAYHPIGYRQSDAK